MKDILKKIYWLIKVRLLLMKQIPKPSKKLIRLLNDELKRRHELLLINPKELTVASYIAIKDLLYFYANPK